MYNFYEPIIKSMTQFHEPMTARLTNFQNPYTMPQMTKREWPGWTISSRPHPNGASGIGLSPFPKTIFLTPQFAIISARNAGHTPRRRRRAPFLEYPVHRFLLFTSIDFESRGRFHSVQTGRYRVGSFRFVPVAMLRRTILLIARDEWNNHSGEWRLHSIKSTHPPRTREY